MRATISISSAVSRTLQFVAFLALTGTAARGLAIPGPISPGEADELSTIASRCPTFSWSAVEGAAAYELVVYRLRQEAQDPEPVMRQRFGPGALSWTPSLKSCLARGERYAWAVRAPEGEEDAEWSPVRLFEVEPAPSDEELLETLRRVQEQLGKPQPAGVDFAGAGDTNVIRLPRDAKGPDSGREETGPAGALLTSQSQILMEGRAVPSALGRVIVSSFEATFPGSATSTVAVDCSPGDYAISGGVGLNNTSLRILGSYSGDDDTWIVLVHNPTGSAIVDNILASWFCITP